jgi:hypothetical protein
MNLKLSDDQAAAIERELRNIVENDRYPFSPRMRTLREILHMIRTRTVDLWSTKWRRSLHTGAGASTSPPTLLAATDDS